MREVNIKILGTQEDQLGEKETVEMVTSARYYRKNGIDYLLYEESEISGMEGSRTSLKIEKNRVLMNRTGSIEAKMDFMEKYESSFLYKSQFGTFNMQVTTDKLEVSMKEALNESKISVAYVLKIAGNDFESRNRLSIEILG